MSGSILFLTSGRDVPSSRFRVEQYLPRLREEGIKADLAPCVPEKYAHPALTPAKVVSRIGSILKAPQYDAVYLELLGELLELLELLQVLQLLCGRIV